MLVQEEQEQHDCWHLFPTWLVSHVLSQSSRLTINSKYLLIYYIISLSTSTFSSEQRNSLHSFLSFSHLRFFCIQPFSLFWPYFKILSTTWHYRLWCISSLFLQFITSQLCLTHFSLFPPSAVAVERHIYPGNTSWIQLLKNSLQPGDIVTFHTGTYLYSSSSSFVYIRAAKFVIKIYSVSLSVILIHTILS